ncbi:MAG TPA: acyltransferase family protein [Actinoplanes sp.]|nr:acyltransferase family protein [Actinoplanes sp.]
MVHRRDIEGLRAVAVLLVVLYHCGVPVLGGGYVGVDVFFVISGFLITSLLLREVTTTGTISIAGFYARRFLRLLPAAVLVTAATVLAAIMWLPPLRAPQIALDGLFATAYGLNYRLAAVGTEYLNADAAPSPLQHFWSLAVEEQFYVVWPVLLLAAYELRRRRGVAMAMAVVVAVSFVVAVWQTRADSTWAYFGSHTRAWELGVGALVAVLGLRLRRRIATAVTAAGLGAIALSAVLFSAETPFPGFAATLPVLGAAAVLLGGTTAPSGLLSEAPLQVIGRLSYSWYLWHWPFLMIGPAALGVTAGLAVNLALAACALLAAALTYALLENPVRHLRSLRARPWRTVGCGLLVTVLTAAGYLVLGTGDAARRGLETDHVAPELAAVTPRALAEGVATPAVPANLTPSLERATTDQPRIYADKCSGGFTDPGIKKPCAYGNTASGRTVVLFGDSHAAHWFPALEKVAQYRGWRLVVVTKSACSAASVRIFQATLNRPYDECVAWRESVWGYLAALKPAMVVMSSAAAGGTLVDDSGAKVTDPGYEDRAWVDGWSRSADRLAGTGAEVVLIEDTPYQSGDTVECLSVHVRDPRACVVSAGAALPNPGRRRAIAAALRTGDVTIVDPLPWFCTAGRCPVIVGNVLVYRDASHITATYSRMLAPLLAAAVE